MKAKRSPNHAAMKSLSRTWPAVSFPVNMHSCNSPGNDQPVNSFIVTGGNDHLKPS